MNSDKYEEIYYSYLLMNGFNPNKYDKVLEIGTREKQAISKKFIGPEIFLLSEDLDYSGMVELGLFGARGYIDNDGINIPRSIETDSFMRYHGAPILRIGSTLSSSTLSDFDAIICPATYERLLYLLSIKKDMFIGACMHSLDPKLRLAKLNIEHFRLIVQTMYRINMEYSKETFDNGMKQILLLKKTW